MSGLRRDYPDLDLLPLALAESQHAQEAAGRLRHIPDVSGESLVGFLRDVAEPGTIIRTDGWRGYAALETMGFKREVIILSASPEPAQVLMPNVYRVAALLKRWILGTLQGGVAKEQLE